MKAVNMISKEITSFEDWRSFAVQRHFPAKLVEEVFEEDDVVPGLLRFRRLTWHQRGDSLAVRRKTLAPESEDTEVGGPLLRPDPGFIRQNEPHFTV
jgi:hypothetical protein